MNTTPLVIKSTALTANVGPQNDIVTITFKPKAPVYLFTKRVPLYEYPGTSVEDTLRLSDTPSNTRYRVYEVSDGSHMFNIWLPGSHMFYVYLTNTPQRYHKLSEPVVAWLVSADYVNIV